MANLVACGFKEEAEPVPVVAAPVEEQEKVLPETPDFSATDAARARAKHGAFKKKGRRPGGRKHDGTRRGGRKNAAGDEG
jgi:hypothetical protein